MCSIMLYVRDMENEKEATIKIQFHSYDFWIVVVTVMYKKLKRQHKMYLILIFYRPVAGGNYRKTFMKAGTKGTFLDTNTG
jgi:hypothetical protein